MTPVYNFEFFRRQRDQQHEQEVEEWFAENEQVPSRTETANTGGAHAPGCKSVNSALKAGYSNKSHQMTDTQIVTEFFAGRELLGPARRIPHLGPIGDKPGPTDGDAA